jgi:hypothetical protein
VPKGGHLFFATNDAITKEQSTRFVLSKRDVFWWRAQMKRSRRWLMSLRNDPRITPELARQRPGLRLNLRSLLALIGFVVGLATLILQFAAIVPPSMDAGRGLFGSVVFYFSFFTILTNLLVVLIYLGALVRGQRWLMFFRKPKTRATAAATVALVGGFYHFALSGLYQLEGLIAFCTFVLHYVTPVLYLVWFAGWNRTGTLKWPAIITMLIYPLLYCTCVMARGALIGEYPYPVLDAGALGYGQVALNIAGLLVLLIVLNAVAVAIDRSLLASKRS